MIRKFECKNCKNQFDADDQHLVVCPRCNSDNVEPYSRRVSATVWKIGLGTIALFAASCFVLLCTDILKQPANIPNPVNPDSPVSQDPATVSVSEPVFNDDGTYSVDVEAINLPRGTKSIYVMLSHFEKKELQRSKDGHFTGIPFCEDDGHSYDFAVVDTKTDSMLCVPVEQTGFIKQSAVKKDERLTGEQLQHLIDTRDASLNGVGESEYLAPDYKLAFTGLSPDEKEPQSWSELFDILDFKIWSGVTVDKISYDDKNRVNAVTLKITH